MNFHAMKLARVLLFVSVMVLSGGMGEEEEEENGDEKEKWKRKTRPGLLLT